MKKIIYALFVIVIFLCACSSQKSAPVQEKAQDQVAQAQISGNQIIISNFAFAPKELTVEKGTIVTWKNDEGVSHTVVSEGFFSSKTLTKGGQFTYEFDQPGEYEYYCSIHPSMKGKVIVK